jgi:hypothetical protein
LEDKTVKFKVLCAGESLHIPGSFTKDRSRISSKATDSLAQPLEIGKRLPKDIKIKRYQDIKI